MSPNSPQKPAEALSAAVSKLLRPLVRLLLRYGIPFNGFADLAKRVYVEVARDEFGIPGRKQSGSRVSVLTGLSRKEVKRVTEAPPPDDADTVQRYNRAARVISGWLRDGNYRDGDGHPLALPLEGGPPDFGELVRTHSGDVPARAILDELLRVGAVRLGDDGRVVLESRAYIPQTGEVDKLAILGVDVHDLLAAIDHNLQCPPEEAFFQRKVSYDNMPADGTENLREIAADRAQKTLEELDRWMSERDRDSNASIGGKGRRRASLGIYYYEEELPEDD